MLFKNEGYQRNREIENAMESLEKRLNGETWNTEHKFENLSPVTFILNF